jgi:hypothetical protein
LARDYFIRWLRKNCLKASRRHDRQAVVMGKEDLSQKKDYTNASDAFMACAIFLPFIGLLGGLWLIMKKEHRRGLVCAGLSIVFGIFWLGVFGFWIPSPGQKAPAILSRWMFFGSAALLQPSAFSLQP